SVAFVIERQTIGLAPGVQRALERPKHRGGESHNWTKGHVDRAPSAFRPVGHREAGDEAANELAAFREELAGRGVQNIEGDLEVAGHELAGDNIAPCGVTESSALGPHAEVPDGGGRGDFGPGLTMPVDLDGGSQ